MGESDEIIDGSKQHVNRRFDEMPSLPSGFRTEDTPENREAEVKRDVMSQVNFPTPDLSDGSREGWEDRFRSTQQQAVAAAEYIGNKVLMNEIYNEVYEEYSAHADKNPPWKG